MKDIVILLAHLLTTVAKLLDLGGAKAINLAEFPPMPGAPQVSQALLSEEENETGA